MSSELMIEKLLVHDLRFPTSLSHDGSDAMHTDPDYSCAYVELHTNQDVKGCSLAFTLGQGTEVVVSGIKALEGLVVGRKTRDIFEDFANFWKSMTSHSQLRWIGPEKGVIHLATAAIVNALWDLWAKLEGKPLWRLLVEIPPEVLISTIDFTYISDVLSKDEALAMLKVGDNDQKEVRVQELLKSGYPAYTTQAGWLGYSAEKRKDLCLKFLKKGFKGFKIKVGQDLEDDKARCQQVRDVIGYDNDLMVDANQKWDVPEAIAWMKELAVFKPLWIEEPTSPDDIIGHSKIAQELKAYGIGVATGEMCANRVMFKQFLQSGGMDFCQIDACRIGGVNELLSIYLMANKFRVKVCPHAGGIGLCEMVQHLQMWDYVSVSRTMDGRSIEYVDQQHEHFKHPVVMQNACYLPPQVSHLSILFRYWSMRGTQKKITTPVKNQKMNIF
ncbi:hypothetical protein AAG570_005834 [Ranatra chinensis]|uniref:Mandelate racemase/muconate lactonizing enzyme C-terminal domain-containing protein n=1 Tax=Ranatra chinensis TaxID=642074 RepID=A0ABD0YKC8_9HEMI